MVESGFDREVVIVSVSVSIDAIAVGDTRGGSRREARSASTRTNQYKARIPHAW
jgi:hypothetical protein